MNYWTKAVLTYGLGDTITTLIGLQIDGIFEANVVANDVIQTFGLWSLIPLKFFSILLFYVIYKRVEHWDCAVGIPIGLTMIGSLITLSNLVVLTLVIFF